MQIVSAGNILEWMTIPVISKTRLLWNLTDVSSEQNAYVEWNVITEVYLNSPVYFNGLWKVTWNHMSCLVLFTSVVTEQNTGNSVQ